MSGTAYGYPCPACGNTRAEIEGWIRDAEGHLKTAAMWCLSCEHHWKQPLW